MDTPHPASANSESQSCRLPTWRESLPVWVKIGLLSFGGPAGQIALMHQEIVDRRRWISDARFLHALNYCMVLPGPEAHQLSIYLGWLINGTLGGIIAGTLFVLPGALLMLAISYAYVYLGDLPWMSALFYGLKASVLALVAAAMIRIGKRVLTSPCSWAITLASFAAIFFLKAPLPLILLVAVLAGLVFGRHLKPQALHEEGPDGRPAAARPTWTRALITGLSWLIVWMLPLGFAYAILGPEHVLVREAVFFSKAALVTFGGAYSVLPYVAQQAVEVHGWLGPEQMMDGLALAETTPGPLILVLQFVGFLGGWNQPGPWSPPVTALAASAISSWMTFAPGFLFIFVGAPFIEYTQGLKRLGAVMSAITAAVLGVILNLSIWFGWHAAFPEGAGLDIFPIAVALFLLGLIQKWKMDALRVVALGAAAGWLAHWAGYR